MSIRQLETFKFRQKLVSRLAESWKMMSLKLTHYEVFLKFQILYLECFRFALS